MSAATTNPFTDRQRRRMATQTGYGRRPLNDWDAGDLPAPWSEGDLLWLDTTNAERVRDIGPGYFVVCCAFSIDDGDAWYFRVTDGEAGSDRLHVAFAERSSWSEGVDYMAPFQLVDTADPDGLAKREAMLAAGWTFKSDRCPTCGSP